MGRLSAKVRNLCGIVTRVGCIRFLRMNEN